MKRNQKLRHRQRLRVIGGKWGGRQIHFPESPQIRPTAARTRETLFNWLQHDIQDARCLDLFAGSGALGIEALSRGARFCDFVDTDSTALNSIKRALANLAANDFAATHKETAKNFVMEGQIWDVIFLDPPFGTLLGFEALTALYEYQCLHPQSLIYLEARADENIETTDTKYVTYREKVAGQVRYQLFKPPEALGE